MQDNDDLMIQTGIGAEIGEDMTEEITGDTAEDGAVQEGDAGYDDGMEAPAEDFTGDSGADTDYFIDGGMYAGDGYLDNGFTGEVSAETGAKDPILSSVPFVAGTIGAALAVGIVLGILLGRKRIKKGFDSYEN